MRSLFFISILSSLAGVMVPLRATTLEQLPLPEMARQSTAIVRGRVLSASGLRRGPDVYTVYRLEVAERWKAGKNTGHTVEVAVPGGVAGGIRQMVAGAPRLRPGGDYLLFLWTGRSGITQVIGLSQGLFGVGLNSQGEWMASRGASAEAMLDAKGRPVRDQAISVKLSELRASVERALREAK
jgi:hypothetical protein